MFEDMISRSVPGYRQILEFIPTLIRYFSHPMHRCYDLGCSLGAGMIAVAEGMDRAGGEIIGIDNSPAMLAQAEKLLASYQSSPSIRFRLQQADIAEHPLQQSSLMLMNFTLQFIALDQRLPLIQRIYNNLVDGGALVLSEKIHLDDARTNQTLIDIHHQYKADQGYSQLEISQKRDALEDVLIPETLDTHLNRLADAGFSVVTPWLQNLQFVSILAIK